ncbi:MAG: RNA polymerase sigma factor [Bacteroidetes bacterium]|nr:RNA polymerase sigma factor [Bacteroidota bacterium]
MTEFEYNQCVTLYADNVFRFIMKNIGHEADARDIVQSAFEKMWLNKQHVITEKSKSYLFTVAYHQMIDHIRKTKKTKIVSSFEQDERVVYQTNNQLKETLMQALNQLNETQKSLVLLKDYEGYNYQEIGEIMNLSESQVKVYLHRARLQLRNYLVSKENIS